MSQSKPLAYISCFNQIEEKDINQNHADPAFRKATANMAGAFQVCQKTLSALNDIQKNSLSVIVATYFGEVSSSLEFLTTLHEQKIAKPILFQNSLHNSTLGFISIQLGLQGPAFTISADQKTEHSVALTAHSLLNLTDHVLVCYVDIVPEYLKKNYEKAFPQLSHHLGWARSFLLSNQKINSTSQEVESAEFKYSSFLKHVKSGEISV